MGALVKLAGVGCIGLMGLAVFNGGGTRSTGGVGPPVIPGSVAGESPPPALASAPAAQSRAVPDWPRTQTIYADADGQFWIAGTASMGNRDAGFRFLADTGASDVVFSKRDARRLGIDVSRLAFDSVSSTANGRVRIATVRLARLSVGPLTVTDFPVSINEGELGEPLLGMAFLRRLNVAIGNGIMTLSGEP